MNIKNRRKNFIYLISVLVVSFVVYIYMYSLIPVLENKLEMKIINISTSDIINSIEKTVYNNLPQEDFIEKLKKDPEYYNQLKNELSVFLSERLKYIFIIYRDSDNRYKYLLDVVSEESLLNLLFIPLKEEKEILEEIYRTKKQGFEIHKELDTIGITYYIPVVQDGVVKSIIIADFSFGVLQEIKSLIILIKRAVLVSSGVILFFLIITIYYFYKNVILKQRAYIDTLTGIYNRNYLEDIRDVIDLNNYTVLMLDIDYFKNINDTYGHQVGDQILKGIANLLKKSLREDDIIIRYGGEEFLILLKRPRNDTEGKWSLQVAQKLLQHIREYEYRGIKLTASIGLNLDTHKARNLIDAIKKADITLYKAKRLGRNRIEIYEESSKFSKEVSLSEVKDLIEQNQVICFYQPVVNIKDGTVLYYEALARIKFKDEYLSPVQYLDLIKGTFLYFKFTKIVIDYNINILKEYPELKVSINMSPSDFLNQSIIDILLSTEQSIVRRIKLEILETEDVHNYNVLKSNVIKLRNYGYDIVLDDFGAGYIDFYYLTEIDAKCIKIDGSVVKKIPYNDQYYKLTKYLIQFCKDIGKVPIAEFVENEEILKYLTELGIEYGQGYLFSKPMPIEKILQNTKPATA